MKVVLVYPEFPITYWGFQYGLSLAGKRSAFPPLGLLQLAALLPQHWELRLVDLNVEKLRERDLLWADVVFTGGMRVQARSMHEVITRAHRTGRRVVVGGPAPTTAPEEFTDADVIFQGEAEGRIDELLEAMGADEHRVIAEPEKFPDVTTIPPPRYDLVDFRRYASMSLQYSRGCPFTCEFCDIIEIFGRVPRVKTPDQILGEMNVLYEQGYRGSLFFVDDNFIGNRSAVKKLLPRIVEWQEARGYPFELFTEASVNLASDEALVAAMVRAGFTAVFLGIETPSPEALKVAKKNQNLAMNLVDAVNSLTGSGLEVMGGFIVGFDNEKADVFDAQRLFLEQAPIPLAMVGLLTALPGTALWRRLEKEGRLREVSSGDQFARPNFETTMDEEQLLRGYGRLLGKLYEPDTYYRRCADAIDRSPVVPGRRRVRLNEITTLLRTVVRVGIFGERRRQFWRFVTGVLRKKPALFPTSIAQVIRGEHMIRYTREDVLPRIEQAIAQVQAERGLRGRADSPRREPSPGASAPRDLIPALSAAER